MIILPFIIIPIVFFIIVFVAIITAIKKSNINNLGSKIEDFSENIFNTVKQEFFGETIEKKDDKQEDIYCEYCGSLMSGDAKKCPNCSASVKKKK